MKKPFQVGDRVAVYWYDGRFKGRVLSVNGDLLAVQFDSGQQRRSHAKQCRRIVKRKPREWWISQGDLERWGWDHIRDGCVHIKEMHVVKDTAK